MSMENPASAMPNSLLRPTNDATFALWMMFLLGRHAILGQEPPIYLRSTIATRLPSPANVHAAMVEPVPPPRITTSNSSCCGFSGTRTDGDVLVPFILMLLRATVRSQLLAQDALSRVD